MCVFYPRNDKMWLEQNSIFNDTIVCSKFSFITHLLQIQTCLVEGWVSQLPSAHALWDMSHVKVPTPSLRYETLDTHPQLPSTSMWLAITAGLLKPAQLRPYPSPQIPQVRCYCTFEQCSSVPGKFLLHGDVNSLVLIPPFQRWHDCLRLL